MTQEQKLAQLFQQRRLSMFMFITLTKAANDWTEWIETVTVREAKHWLSVYKNAGNKVKNHLQKALGEDYDHYEEDAFIWGDMLDSIRKADSIEKKQEGLRVSGQAPDTPLFPLHIFIPFNVPSKKNSKRIITLKNGRKLLISSKASQEYQKSTSRYYESYAANFREMVRDLKPPYTVFFKLIRKDRRAFDYNNILQMVQDMMVAYEWIEDDNANILRPIPIQYEIDKGNPGVLIWV